MGWMDQLCNAQAGVFDSHKPYRQVIVGTGARRLERRNGGFMRFLAACWLAVVLVWSAATSTVSAAPLTWPRTVDGETGARIVLYQPQVDGWDSFVTLRFRLAAELFLPGNDQPIPAALQMQAATTTNLGARTVTASDLKIVDVNINSADETIETRLRGLINAYVSGMTQTLSLDTVLAHFEQGAERPGPEAQTVPVEKIERPKELAGTPPKILVNFTPSVLVLFDGEPIFAEIEKAGLEFAVNTNWDLFHDPEKSTYYLLHEEAWLKASDVNGPWAPAGRLPKAFSKLPETESFNAVSEHVPGEKIKEKDVPKVFVSMEPAELILIDGRPVEEPIPGTGLVLISNTESDLFRKTASGDYYYLVSGRWFRTSSLNGEWSSVGDDLPEDFAKIPAGHTAASVRVSVAGTPEAEEAVLLANIPQKAEVNRADATVTVTYNGEPEFRKVTGTNVYYAANTTFDVFRVDSRYYVCFQGVWFEAGSAQGPWVVSVSVPSAIYTIPPSSPKYHVTYVYVYDSTPDTVVVGYTSGYSGVYVSNGVVVYGTGYYYSPYVYYPAYGYPVYYAYPYSYGVAAYYNPYTGGYGRGSAVYGPYGGAGWGAAYNPNTGTYARGVSAWGPYESGFAGQAYNPWTDTYGATYQRSNPYASWGETVVSRGDEWVHTGHYSDSRGTVAGAETSQGGKVAGVQTDQGTAYAGKDADNNLYAGKDGNVYRRSEEGWSSYDDGDWQTVERPDTTSDAFQERQTQAQQSWSERSGGTFQGLESDRLARDSASKRSANFESWRGSRSRSSGGRSRSGGRIRR